MSCADCLLKVSRLRGGIAREAAVGCWTASWVEACFDLEAGAVGVGAG